MNDGIRENIIDNNYKIKEKSMSSQYLTLLDERDRVEKASFPTFFNEI